MTCDLFLPGLATYTYYAGEVATYTYHKNRQLRPIPTTPATYTYRVFRDLRPIPTGSPGEKTRSAVDKASQKPSCDLYLPGPATYTYYPASPLAAS